MGLLHQGEIQDFILFFSPGRLLLVTDPLYHLRSQAIFVGRHNSPLAVWHPTNPGGGGLLVPQLLPG